MDQLKRNLEPLDYDAIIDEYIETEQFNDKLYEMCSFSEEYDDYRKWLVISWSPNAMDFKNDLIEFAWDYCKQVRTDNLKDWEKPELLARWNDRYDDIFSNLSDGLVERACEE